MDEGDRHKCSFVSSSRGCSQARWEWWQQTVTCLLDSLNPETSNEKFPSLCVTLTSLPILKRCSLLTYLYYSSCPKKARQITNSQFGVTLWSLSVEKKSHVFLLLISQRCTILHFLWVLASIVNTGDLQSCMIKCGNIPLEGVTAPPAVVNRLNTWWTRVSVLTLL